MVQSAFPHAEFTLVDLAIEMLEKAQSRFSKMGHFPELLIGNYVEIDLGESYDLVISALSIHHLSDSDKQSLYRKIYNILSPGGMFVNADLVLGKTSDLEKLYSQHWLNSVLALGISLEDLQTAQKRMEYDRLAPLDVQLSWLNNLGFQNVDCWYKNFRFAVFGGFRPIQAD